MGGFHIIIYLPRTMRSCLRNARLVQLLSRVGLEGKSTIQNVLKDADVKYGTYLY